MRNEIISKTQLCRLLNEAISGLIDCKNIRIDINQVQYSHDGSDSNWFVVESNVEGFYPSDNGTKIDEIIDIFQQTHPFIHY